MNPSRPDGMRYIGSAGELAAAVKKIAAEDLLAVDTEADSLHHYLEKLCLVQVSTSSEDFVLDPLVPLDLTPLAEVLRTKRLIFHGADFDLRMLRRAFAFRPRTVFDTMIAAQLLGYPSQSFAALAERHFGVHLPKANQKADWSRRPLTESMLTYAAHDTHYLWRLFPILESELKEKGRLGWLEESCAAVIAAAQTERENDPASRWRVKGSGALKGRELALLREAWQWREEEARRRDRPGFKVLLNEGLIAVAKWKAANPKAPLEEMPDLPRQLDRARVRPLEERLAAGFAISPETLERKKPSGLFPRRLSADDEKRLAALKTARTEIAKELGCDPGIIAPNSALEAIAAAAPADESGLRAAGGLKNWQAAAVAAGFLAALRSAAEQDA